MRVLSVVAAAVLGVAPGLAGAATVVSWNTEGDFALTSSKTFGSLEVTAFSPSGTASGSTYSRGATDGSTWIAAQLRGWGSSGFGVKNANTNDTNEGTSPEHAVDNQEVVDVVVYKLPSVAGFTWSFNSLSVGWNGSGSGSDGSPEVNVWIGGGSAPIDFLKTCFVGCGSGVTSLRDQGFAYAGRVDFNTGGNSFQDAQINGADSGDPLFTAANKDATGQYIVIAASSTSGKIYDAFKLKELSANKIDKPDEPPPPGVPEPRSLALIAAGMIGLRLYARRKS